MRSAREWGKSLAAVAGAAALAGIVPGPVPAHTAFAADACGQVLADFAGTFTGSVLQGDGPETLSYTIEFTNSGTFYTATLVVSDTTGSYQTQGVPLILTVQSLGNVVLTVPHWNFDNRVSYEKVTATDTQCQPGPLPGGGSVAPPTVTSFVIRPMNGAEIVLIRQS